MNNKYPTTKPSLNLDFANTKSLDPRITFRRGTPGTYYDGVTHVKAEENLIDYSEDFSQWGAGTGLTIVSNNNTAPDGTSTASLIDDGTDAGYKQLYHAVNILDGLYSASVYVKNPSSNGRQFLILGCYFNSSNYSSITFDTLNQTIQSSDASSDAGTFSFISSSFSSVGNDWYRIEMNFESKGYSLFTFNINMSDSGDAIWGKTYTGSNQQLYIWGAQLEQRDSVTTYTKTEGAPVTKYQPKLMTASPDTARFDHDPLTGESKGLLIEEQRTNLVWYSEDFGIRARESQEASGVDGWSYIRCTLNTNGPISPDGITKSVIMEHDVSGTNAGGLFISAYNGYDDKYMPEGTNTYSWYAKNAGVNFFIINTGGGNKVFFDLTNGTAKSFATLIDSYGIEHVGNGWYRCHVVTSQTTGLFFYQSDQDNDGTSTVSGSGGVAVWGPQFEPGSFPTSYIKTTGASATRSADNASITGENFSSWYRQDEGTLYSEVNTLADSSVSRISMSDGTSSNRIFISNGIYPLYVNKNGNIQVREESSAIVNAYSKRAAGLKKDDFAVSIDGGDPLIDTAGDLPFVDRLAFSTSHVSDNHVNGHIKKLAYYPQRITNEQLQNLTK